MTTELTPTQSFQQRLSDRIRADIGDLMPDEMLSGLIAKSIDEAFFKPRERVVKDNYGRDNKTTRPPAFEVIVQRAIRDRVNQQIKLWLKDHESEIAKALTEYLDKSCQKMVVEAFAGIFSSSFYNLKNEIERAMGR